MLRFYDGLNRERGVGLSRAHNDVIAEVNRVHKDRFVGLATVPLQYPEEAVKELEKKFIEFLLEILVSEDETDPSKEGTGQATESA